MPERPELSAFITHLVAQTRQNVEFLVSQDVIERGEAHSFLAKLPTENEIALRDLSEQTRRMTIPSPSLSQPPIALPSPSAHPPAGPPVPQMPPAQPNVRRAKALWAYNENGLEPKDLSFHVGDVIEIVVETNADWWTGKFNGKQGPFPSSYVEKIPSSATPPPYPPPLDTQMISSPEPYQSGPKASYEPVYNGSPLGGYQSQASRPYSSYPPQPSQPILPQQFAVQQGPPQVNPHGGSGYIVTDSIATGSTYGSSGIF